MTRLIPQPQIEAPAKGLEPLAVDVRDAARLCGISRTTFLGLVNSGKAPEPIRLGRRVLWHAGELDAWLRAGAPNRDAWERIRGDR